MVGLFGDVKHSDLVTMSNMIKTLHIVAPQLNIKYSDHAESVNLPIHFVPCTEYFSDKAYKCKNRALGTYHFNHANISMLKSKMFWESLDGFGNRQQLYLQN